MTTMPHISVIVTAHNVEKYIGRCIRSILEQSLPESDYEIIVINDGSADRTRFVLEIFESDIKIINNARRMGLPKSLNKAIRSSRGKYIVRLDGDDYVNREFLKILMLHLELNPGMDAIACDYLMVDDRENVLASKNCLEEPIACGIMFRTPQLMDIGLYDEKFLAREEEDLRIRFLRKHTIDRVQLPLYRYRKHDKNMTNDRGQMEKYRKILHKKHKARG